MPYRLNSINIDPDDTVSADVEFRSTSESVAPRLNSVVMIRFQTVGGRAIVIRTHLADGSVVDWSDKPGAKEKGSVTKVAAGQ